MPFAVQIMRISVRWRAATPEVASSCETMPRTNALSEQDTSELTEKFKAWLKANPQYQ